MGSSKQPAPPDYTRASSEAVYADLNTLAARRQVEMAARAGTAGSVTVNGKPIAFNFSGMGDADFARAQTEADRLSAIGNAQTVLGIQKEFGADFLAVARDQLRQSDPIGFALREAMGQTISGELAAGGAMSDSDRRNVTQSIRALQTRTGNTDGVAAGVAEVMGQADYSRNLLQSRLGNAAAFLNGATPAQQFGTLRGATTGAVPVAPTTATGPGINNNIGSVGAQFASNLYSTQAGIYNTATNAPNYWMQGAGMLAGMASQGIMAGALMCWVAREVYGTERPDWMLFRHWMLEEGPTWFRRAYLKYGERFAAWLSNKPRLKMLVRRWMDARVANMLTRRTKEKIYAQ